MAAEGSITTTVTSLTTTVGQNTTAISQNYLTLTQADQALSDKIDNISASSGDASSAVQTEQTARIQGDDALTAEINTLRSTVGDNFAAFQNEVTARATGDSSLTTAVTNLTSVTNSAPTNTLNANPMFSAWPTGQTYPTGWKDWITNTGGSFVRSTSENNAPGTYSLLYTAPANVSYAICSTPLYVAAGWYVLEADVYLSGGTYEGAGVTLGGQPGAYINFALDPDINGTTSTYTPPRRKFSKLINIPAYDAVTLHPMAGWTEGFGASTAKQIYFSRCSIRVASDAEVKGGKAFDISNANTATINSNYTTLTNADSALSAKIDTVSSQAGANAAAITTEATTRSAADSSISSLIDTLDSNYQGLFSAANTRMTTEEQTRANADGALASRTSTLESNFNLTNDNPLYALVRTNANTAASATQALATKTDTLQASSSNALNLNAYFTSDYSGGAPYGYVWWNNGSPGVIQAGQIPHPYSTANDVYMATYYGSTYLTVTYGRTIIDGDFLKTGTVMADRIVAGTITTDRLIDHSVTSSILLQSGQTFQGNGGAGTYTPPTSGGGSGGGGSACPEVSMPVLMANEERDGPGDFRPAGQVQVGDWMWTQHEYTREWGAFRVVRAHRFTDILWRADGLYRATESHPMWLDGRWTIMREIGEADEVGTAVLLTVRDAHTFVGLTKSGEQLLQHNKMVSD